MGAPTMESSCLRHTDLPHTSRLFADFLYHHDRVAHFYTVPSGRTCAQDYPAERRAALVDALREQNGDHPALEVLAQPGARAYVTGQQVGLFSGPAYTIYKALTAVRLAEQSTAEGKPAVAIFWLATEDHDFAEVNHAWSFGPDAQPVSMSVNGHKQSEEPVGSIAISHWPVEELHRSFGDLPYAGEVTQLVRETYTPGKTMGCAFRDLVQRLLEKFNLLYLDPLHPAIRRLGAPFLASAVAHEAELSGALLARNKELEASGYHAQVHVEEKTSLFFLLEGTRRINLKRQNGEYVSRDRHYAAKELADRAEQLSPNALLRPVMQDFMIPTASYIGGPAEVAYLAQSQVMYERLLGHMPRVMPRSGFTLFDARAQKLMERYKVDIHDFFNGREAFIEKFACALSPPQLSEHFAEVRRQIQASLENLQSEVTKFDPTLGDALSKSRAKMLYQLSKSESKVARETLRRNTRAVHDAIYLYGKIMPHKHLQERFYSILPFLAEQGLDLIDRLHEAVRLECPDHILLTL